MWYVDGEDIGKNHKFCLSESEFHYMANLIPAKPNKSLVIINSILARKHHIGLKVWLPLNLVGSGSGPPLAEISCCVASWPLVDTKASQFCYK